MGKPNYRVLVSFDSQRAIFTARAPELEHLSGDGPTRRDAVCKLEEEIDAQLANMLSLGSTPPKAVDEDEFSGEVNARISRSLHRDLAYLARTEGVEVDQIVSELLSAALAMRQGGRGAGRGRHPNQASQAFADPADDIGNRVDGNHRGGNADGNRADGNRRGYGGRGYSPQLLDDRANFIEYVRNQENNPGGHGRQGHHGGGGGGGGGHNNHNNNNRRRRRGGGQGNGQQQHGRDGNRMHGGRPDGGGRGPGGGGAPQHGNPVAVAPPGSSGPGSVD